jgi:hypothetical protein
MDLSLQELESRRKILRGHLLPYVLLLCVVQSLFLIVPAVLIVTRSTESTLYRSSLPLLIVIVLALLRTYIGKLSLPQFSELHDIENQIAKLQHPLLFHGLQDDGQFKEVDTGFLLQELERRRKDLRVQAVLFWAGAGIIVLFYAALYYLALIIYNTRAISAVWLWGWMPWADSFFVRTLTPFDNLKRINGRIDEVKRYRWLDDKIAKNREWRD